MREFKKKILYSDIDLKKICLRTNFDSVVSIFSKSDYNKVAVHAMHLTPKKYNFLPLFYCKRKRKKEISECDMFSDVSCQSLPISYDEFFRVALTRRLFCFQMFFFFYFIFEKFKEWKISIVMAYSDSDATGFLYHLKNNFANSKNFNDINWKDLAILNIALISTCF